MNAIIGSGFGSQSLNGDDLRRLAPSVYANEPAPGMSDRYQFVNTADIIDNMMSLGYYPVKAGQALVKNATGGQYAKHVVRMMHERYLDPSKREVGDVVPQVLLTNSHNRSSAFHMTAGLERLWCKNGMATPVAGFTSFRVLHNDKNIHQLIIDGTNLVRELTETTVLPQVEKMMALELSPTQERDFANACTVLKFGTLRESEAPMLLECRRTEDAGRSMWNVLNRIQENVVKGGYATHDTAGRNITARGIQSVAKDYDFNVKLWNFGAKVLEELTA